MSQNRARVLVPTVCALALSGLFAAAPASANVVGTLDIGSTGTVVVSASTVTFSPTSPAVNMTTTAGTTLTYDAGTALGVGVSGVVKNLTGVVPVASFMTFPSVAALVFNLSAVGPGVANTACGSLAVGGTCSVVAGSPFILQLTSGGTAATFSVSGSDTDGVSTGTWSGLFTAQIAGMTPAQIQAAILGGGSTQPVSFSGSFIASSTVIPEPASALMVGAGLLGALAMVRRRRRQ